MTSATTPEQDRKIYDWVCNQGESKVETAKFFGVSPRTVGRAIDRHLRTIAETTTPEEKQASVTPDQKTGDRFHVAASSRSYSVLASSNSITITRDDGESATINQSDEKWESIKESVWTSNMDQDVLEECFEEMNIKVALEKFSCGQVQVDVENNVVSYKNKEIPGELHDRVVEATFNREMESVENLCAFIEKLYENPSYRAVQGLYRFLKAKNIKIIEDGMVECFKKVRDNFTDCRTGTFDNRPGKNPKVDRNEVDEDPDRTCSKGLHVCSERYLNHFYGRRVIKVLVHPKDFVAVPYDYNDAKARVCEYYVIKEIET